MENRFTIGLLVVNQFGVLNRVAGLYSKRGYNIESISVGTTEDKNFSRMTIVSNGDEQTKIQVYKQLLKLHDVKKVEILDFNTSISVEHSLIKLRPQEKQKKKLTKLINEFHGKILNFFENFLIIELTGESEKIEKFLKEISGIEILEVCRSGIISMSDNSENILKIK